MANNCYNHIFMYGFKNKSDIDKITNWLKSYDKFDYIRDWVNSILDNTEKPSKDFDYGGRWFDFDFDADVDSVQIFGDSAWIPMLGMCELLSKEFEITIDIKFEEPGINFGGSYMYKNGYEGIIFYGTYNQYLYYYKGINGILDELDYFAGDKEAIEGILDDISNNLSNHDKKILNEYISLID